MHVVLKDEAATGRLGARLAALCALGDVLALSGDLGAGKTAFARGFLRAWCADPDLAVPSPTFTLVQTYEGSKGPAWHFDLYRIEAAPDLLELGLEDALDEAVTLIEWPDLSLPFLPASRLTLTFSSGPDGAGRTVRLDGGPHWDNRLVHVVDANV
ncbi:MAG: tRNA (adenosine(37)-N6)-threonylcarbamoyltransferase complex ATPase subunit type 1 TsaE [Pseudomonadota bacterium]